MKNRDGGFIVSPVAIHIWSATPRRRRRPIFKPAFFAVVACVLVWMLARTLGWLP